MEIEIYEIDNWRSCFFSPYGPPELGFCIIGEVFNHPKHTDGKTIRTSRVDKINGNIITTENSTKYKLKTPNKEFLEFCKKNNHYIPTESQPIKVHKNDN